MPCFGRRVLVVLCHASVGGFWWFDAMLAIYVYVWICADMYVCVHPFPTTISHIVIGRVFGLCSSMVHVNGACFLMVCIEPTSAWQWQVSAARGICVDRG